MKEIKKFHQNFIDIYLDKVQRTAMNNGILPHTVFLFIDIKRNAEAIEESLRELYERD